MSKPFSEDEDELPNKPTKSGLKNVSSQKSIFDNVDKKPTQEDLNKKVKDDQNRISSHKVKASELNSQFYKIVADKTLPKNKNLFQQEMERDLMSKMIQLASDINNDADEGEGMGTLVILVPLMKTCLNQRDRLNNLEYAFSQLEKKLEPATLSCLLTKENQQILDKKKTSE